MIVFIFDWFKPSHCDKCAKAERQQEPRFWDIVARNWFPEEVADLNAQARFLAEED